MIHEAIEALLYSILLLVVLLNAIKYEQWRQDLEKEKQQ